MKRENRRAGRRWKDCVPSELREDFDRELMKRNLRVACIALPCILLFETYNIIRVLFLSRSGLGTVNNRTYFSLYAAMFLLTALGLILLVWWRGHAPKNSRVASWIEYVYAVCICVFGTAITVLDSRKIMDISVYTIIVIAVAVFFDMRPGQAASLFLGNHVLLCCLIPLFVGTSLSAVGGGLLNATVIAVISLIMALTRYHGRREDFCNRAMIVRQSEQIHQINMELNRLVVTDTLSGLSNRRVLENGLPERWEACIRAGGEAAVIMLDIDDFKRYNDRFGHQQGDECIGRTGALIRRCAAGTDHFLIRYGGEEFAVVLLHTSERQAREVAESIRAGFEEMRIENPDSSGGYMTISCGLALGRPEQGQTSRVFFRHADQALYEAKRTGKNRVVTVEVSAD